MVLEEKIGPVHWPWSSQSMHDRGRAPLLRLPQLPSEGGTVAEMHGLPRRSSCRRQRSASERSGHALVAGNPVTFVPVQAFGPSAPRRPDLAKFARLSRCVVYVFCDENGRAGQPRSARQLRPAFESQEESGDRIGCGRPLPGSCRRGAFPTATMSSPSSRATRWGGPA